MFDYPPLPRQFTPFQITVIAAVATTGWGAFSIWAFRKFKKAKGAAYCSRIVSTVHSSLMCGMCLADLIYEWEHARFARDSTAIEQVITAISFGYFAVDLVGICIGPYFDWTFLGHHILTLIGLGTSAFGWDGFETCLTLFVLESSNPSMHMRWMALADKVDLNSLYFKTLDWSFMILFVLARLVYGPVLLTSVFVNPSLIQIRVFGVLFQIFSLTFFIDVVKKKMKGEIGWF